jgi:hypothetical protein
MRARVLALLGGSCAGLVGVIGLLHTPYGRPLMRRLGMGCPAAKVSPAEVEAVRRRAVAALRTEVPSPARPAVGQTLDVSRVADVNAWAQAHRLACVESPRPTHTVRCEGSLGEPSRDPRVPPIDQLVFGFAPDGRLVSVDRLRSRLTATEASRLFGQTADELAAALGPGRLVGDATPDYLAGGSMHTARLQYRYSDYLATVTAMNVAGRLVMHEQYESARGG